MSNARYTNMGHARYIGRIGALAVALGIGAGMFAMPFVASAKPSKPDTSSSTDSASTTSSSTDSASTTSTAPLAKKPKVPVTKLSPSTARQSGTLTPMTPR